VAVTSDLTPKYISLSELLKTNNAESFQLSNVICEILKRCFKKAKKIKKVETIIIHIDEYQLYINKAQEHQQVSWTNSCNFFKKMLEEIGSVMYGYNIETEFVGKYFIIPICTGTSAIDVHFLPIEYPQILLELQPLNYDSVKSMFLDKYEYSRQTTDEGRNLVIQSLKSYYLSDLNNEDIGKLLTDFCNFILNQQHFQIVISDTGFIPKFIDDLLSSSSTLTSDFDWENQLYNQIFRRNIWNVVGKVPGDWKHPDNI
jgi:hypothetical protein